MLDDFDIDVPEEGSPPEEAGNRTFLMVAGGLGALMLLSLICMAVYALVILPRNRAAEEAAEATARAQNTALAQSLTETAIAQAFSPTPSETPVPPTATETPSPTASLAITETTTAEGPTADPRTATVRALLTQAAIAQTQAAESILTVTPTPTEALPDTGFIDDMGAPGLFGMAMLLLAVIFVVRRLRTVEG